MVGGGNMTKVYFYITVSLQASGWLCWQAQGTAVDDSNFYTWVMLYLVLPCAEMLGVEVSLRSVNVLCSAPTGANP